MPCLEHWAPEGATHYFMSLVGTTSGGYTEVLLSWYRANDTHTQWHRWHTDNDNEYPEWRTAQQNADFLNSLIPLR